MKSGRGVARRRAAASSILAIAATAVPFTPTASAAERANPAAVSGATYSRGNGSVTFTTLGQAAINAAGHLVFPATADGVTGFWAMTTPGNVTPMYQNGQPAPGTPGTTLGVGITNNGPHYPILAPSGQFVAVTRAASGTSSAGYIAFAGSLAGNLEKIARSGEPRQNGTAAWKDFFTLAMSPAGRFTIRDYADVLYTGTSAASLSPVAASGKVLDGQAIYSARESTLTRGGTILFNATPTLNSDRYIGYAYYPGAPTSAARLLIPGNPAPATAGAAAFYRATDAPYANTAGDFVVTASLTNATSLTGLWEGNLATPGTLKPIVAPGAAVPGAARTTFANITHPSIASSGRVFFSATLAGIFVTATNGTSVWTGTSPTDLHLLAREGTPVDNVAGIGPGYTWGWSRPAANDAGQVVLETRFRGGGEGLIGYDPSLGLVSIVKTGDTLEVAPGLTKVVTSLTRGGDDPLFEGGRTNDGGPAGLNDAGVVAYRAVFADGTTGVFTARIPVAGDATYDGIVDHADFKTLYDNFGKPGDRSKGDFNFDGLVDFTDFQILERNFGRRPPSAATEIPPLTEAEIASVPEPATGALGAVAALGWTTRRARRRA